MPDEIAAELYLRGLPTDEVGLREALEARVLGWELFRLTPPAAKRWKCHYRLLMTAGIYDGQTAPECYARGLLATFAAPGPAPDANPEA